MAGKNKVVVRFLDGRILKGVTWDFLPNKEKFHVADATDERHVTEVSAGDLKAVFFVRTFTGNREYRSRIDPGRLAATPGVKLKVVFLDGEVLYGISQGYTRGRSGFFLAIVDEKDNNERVYVFVHATRTIETFQPAAARAVR